MSLMKGPPEMMAVHENKEANRLTTIYAHEFEKLFGIKPILDPNGFHIATFKEIATACKDKAEDLVRHFFKMRDEWFQKQGYTPECLKKHLPMVSMDLQRKSSFTHKGELKMHITLTCDQCFSRFILTTTESFLSSGKPRFCISCLDQQNTEQKESHTRGEALPPN